MKEENGAVSRDERVDHRRGHEQGHVQHHHHDDICRGRAHAPVPRNDRETERGPEHRQDEIHRQQREHRTSRPGGAHDLHRALEPEENEPEREKRGVAAQATRARM